MNHLGSKMQLESPLEALLWPQVIVTKCLVVRPQQCPCTELKQRFPNLYMELMQMNNSENKSYNTIPYMLINLGDVDTICIGRDTPVAYIKGEDASCEYVEVNEIIEDIWDINWQPPHECKMVTSDLVYSPVKVTEHRHVELKDQSISQDTKRKFKELKEQFPKVSS